MLVLGVAACLALLAYQRTRYLGQSEQELGGRASHDVRLVRHAGM